LGIDVRVGLPGVGQNLADHPLLMGLTFKARRPLGPIRDNGGGAMVNWRSSPVLAAPDLHAFVVQGPHTSPEQAREWGPDVFAISPGLMRSASVGWLTLSSDDPLAAPVIQPNFLAEPGDVDALVESIDFVLDLAQTAAYRELMERPLWPSRRLDRAEKVDFVRRACSTFFHTAGTCAIGTVVNPELRVLGVDALRIVDASVFPKLPSCNTTAPVIAVAERAGDLIRGREGEPG
jgi:choline dehydrogenase